MIVGERWASPEAVHVYDGKTGAELCVFTNPGPAAWFGQTVGAGDVDGNGKANVAAGPYQGPRTRPRTGAMSPCLPTNPDGCGRLYRGRGAEFFGWSCTPCQTFQIPPDFVVKYQAIDIMGLICFLCRGKCRRNIP